MTNQLNIRQSIIDIIQTVQPISRSCGLGEDGLNKARAAVGQYEPHVVVYGRYNAGKSTLINALISEKGESIAKIADAPCTSKVDEYTWRDITFVDTPGIHAPIEHQRCAVTELKKATMVLFVVSTAGTFDEEEVIEELKSIIRSRVPVFIVINNKDGYTPDSPALKNIIQTLNKHVVDVVDEHSFVQFIQVNAKSGMRSKSFWQEPHKAAKLWERSGMDILSTELQHRIAKTSEGELCLPAFQILESELAKIETKLLESIQDAQLSQQQHTIQTVHNERRQIEDAGNQHIKALGNQLVGQLFQAFSKGQDGQAVVGKYINDVQGYLQTLVDEQVQAMIQVTDAPNSPKTRDAEGFVVSDNVRGLLMKGADKEVLKQGMLQLRRMKVPMFKGRWESTLSRWAGNTSKYLGPVINIAMFAFELWSASKKQKQAEAERQRFVEECKQAAQSVLFNVQQEVTENWQFSVRQHFEPIINRMESVVDEGSQRDQQNKEHLETVRSMNDRLKSLKVQISQ